MPVAWEAKHNLYEKSGRKAYALNHDFVRWASLRWSKADMCFVMERMRDDDGGLLDDGIAIPLRTDDPNAAAGTVEAMCAMEGGEGGNRPTKVYGAQHAAPEQFVGIFDDD